MYLFVRNDPIDLCLYIQKIIFPSVPAYDS